MLEIMRFFVSVWNWVELPDSAILLLWIGLFWLPLTRIAFFWIPRKYRQIRFGR